MEKEKLEHFKSLPADLAAEITEGLAADSGKPAVRQLLKISRRSIRLR